MRCKVQYRLQAGTGLGLMANMMWLHGILPAATQSTQGNRYVSAVINAYIVARHTLDINLNPKHLYHHTHALWGDAIHFDQVDLRKALQCSSNWTPVALVAKASWL